MPATQPAPTLQPEVNHHFAQDVFFGLSGNPKRVSSKYFYDARGSRLFQQIMALDEYYPTRSEYAVFAQHKAALLDLFQTRTVVGHAAGRQSDEAEVADREPFELVELGAGDGLKVKILLEHFLAEGAAFSYLPIDISATAVDGLLEDLQRAFPTLRAEGVVDDYSVAMHKLQGRNDLRKVVLFLGGNIGNLSQTEAIRFLASLGTTLTDDDLLLVGFDLRKDPRQILRAYDDAAGVTRDFNLNLLRRINDELGGDFRLDQFVHYPTYDPLSGEVRSFLVSTCAQTVRVQHPSATFHFDAWEAIHTEISRKYSLAEINRLAQSAGFRVVETFQDQANYFVDVAMRKA